MRRHGFIVILGCVFFLDSCRFIPENKSGAELYSEKCASCHGFKGEGVRQLIPAVNNPERLKAWGDSLPCLLRYGIKGRPEKGNQPMPGFPELEADDAAAIWQHLWALAGQSDKKITLADVRRSGCMD